MIRQLLAAGALVAAFGLAYSAVLWVLSQMVLR